MPWKPGSAESFPRPVPILMSRGPKLRAGRRTRPPQRQAPCAGSRPPTCRPGRQGSPPPAGPECFRAFVTPPGRCRQDLPLRGQLTFPDLQAGLETQRARIRQMAWRARRRDFSRTVGRRSYIVWRNSGQPGPGPPGAPGPGRPVRPLSPGREAGQADPQRGRPGPVVVQVLPSCRRVCWTESASPGIAVARPATARSRPVEPPPSRAAPSVPGSGRGRPQVALAEVDSNRNRHHRSRVPSDPLEPTDD